MAERPLQAVGPPALPAVPDILEAVEAALALAEALGPLWADVDGPLRAQDALAAFAEASGLEVRWRRAARMRALWLIPPQTVDGAAEAGRAIGIGAALRAEARWRPAPAAARLLPSGLWGACLAVAAVSRLGVSAGRRIAWVEAAAPAAQLAGLAEVTSDLGPEVHLWISGDGGVPYHDGDQRVLPLTVGRRGACWLEFAAGLDPAAEGPLDREAHPAPDAVGALLRALAALPAALVPLHHAGPVFQDTWRSRLRGASAARRVWLEALGDPAQRQQALAEAPPGPRAYLQALLEPDAQVTRLDAGRHLDRPAAGARAMVDLRVPADATLDAALAAVMAAATVATDGVVQARELARRSPRLSPLDHSLRATLTRSLGGAGVQLAVVAEQARREQLGLPWEQQGAPVFGFAPAWVGDELDAAAGLQAGDLPVSSAGLRWGATLMLATLWHLAGGQTSG